MDGSADETPFDFQFEGDGDVDVTIDGTTYEIDSPYDIGGARSKKRVKPTKKKIKKSSSKR